MSVPNTAEKTESASTDDYLRGMIDCEDGRPHRSGESVSYDRGYSFQYELQQIETARSERQ